MLEVVVIVSEFVELLLEVVDLGLDVVQSLMSKAMSLSNVSRTHMLGRGRPSLYRCNFPLTPTIFSQDKSEGT